jgi:DNA-directed RNA polymerase alpha subunit
MSAETLTRTGRPTGPRQQPPKEILDSLLASVFPHMSARTRNCLALLGVKTAADLLRLTPPQILAIPNAGPKTLDEILRLARRIKRIGGVSGAPRPEHDPDEDAQHDPQLALFDLLTDSGDAPAALSPAALSSQKLLDIPVSALAPISTRAANCLRAMAVETAGDLLRLTLSRARATPNLGRKTLTEIMELARRVEDMTKMGSDLCAETGYDLEIPARPRLVLADLDLDVLCRLLVPLHALPFCARARHCFVAMRLRYIGDVIQLRERDLRRERNVWRETIRNVETQVGRLGFGLGTEVIGWGERIARTLAARHAERVAAVTTRFVLSGMATCLEEELRELAEVAGSPRDTDIAAARLGWAGSNPRHLAEVGAEHGISRERVRQITVRVEKRLANSGIRPPFLLRALEELRGHKLAPTSLLDQQLEEQGITRGRFGLEGVLTAARLLDLGEVPDLAKVGDERFVIQPGLSRTVAVIHSAARKLVSRRGVGAVEDVLALLEQGEVRRETIIAVLEAPPGFEWLGKDHRWFWFPEDFPIGPGRIRNPLVRSIQRILAVGDRLHVSELQAGVARRFHRSGFAPPPPVLLEVCRRLPWAEVDGEMISGDARVSWKTRGADDGAPAREDGKRHGKRRGPRLRWRRMDQA